MKAERITDIQPDRTVDDIIRQCKEGDPRAFTHLVRSHQPYAFALAFRMLSDEDEASEIVQESFIRVWKNMHRYDPSQKFTTWLYAIVSRLCLDRIRSLARSRKLFRRRSESTLLEGPYDPTDPEKILTNREIATIIAQLSEDLSPTQRLVFTLRDLQQCTIEEVCEITGLSTGSVKTNLSYARRQIRHRLVQQYDITGSQP
ncbi:MAG: RNA polymerase sigma factor [Ignavibacteria bacterium]|nr:RNA polymerase sigma factor [Ignavibacteria bacterium]